MDSILQMTGGVLEIEREMNRGQAGYKTPYPAKVPSGAVLDAEMRKLGFCIGRQAQQLGQRIDMRFTVQDDQTLHAILDVFRQYCMSRWLFFFVFLHSLRPPPGQIEMAGKS